MFNSQCSILILRLRIEHWELNIGQILLLSFSINNHVAASIDDIGNHLEECGFENGFGGRGVFSGLFGAFSQIGFKTVVRYKNSVLGKGLSDIDSCQRSLGFIQIFHRIEAKNHVVFTAIFKRQFFKIGRGQITLKRMKFFHDRGRNRQTTYGYRIGV